MLSWVCSIQWKIPVWISGNFKWQMEQQFAEFLEKSETFPGVRCTKFFWYFVLPQFPFHLTFLDSEFPVEWFTFWKFNNFFPRFWSSPSQNFQNFFLNGKCLMFVCPQHLRPGQMSHNIGFCSMYHIVIFACFSTRVWWKKQQVIFLFLSEFSVCTTGVASGDWKI